MRTIHTIVLHSSATYADQVIGAAEIDAMHRARGWPPRSRGCLRSPPGPLWPTRPPSPGRSCGPARGGQPSRGCSARAGRARRSRNARPRDREVAPDRDDPGARRCRRAARGQGAGRGGDGCALHLLCAGDDARVRRCLCDVGARLRPCRGVGRGDGLRRRARPRHRRLPHPLRLGLRGAGAVLGPALPARQAGPLPDRRGGLRGRPARAAEGRARLPDVGRAGGRLLHPQRGRSPVQRPRPARAGRPATLRASARDARRRALPHPRTRPARA